MCYFIFYLAVIHSTQNKILKEVLKSHNQKAFNSNIDFKSI